MRIISMIMFCLAVAGCARLEEPSVANGKKQYEKGKTYLTDRMEYVDFDGHEYVRWVHHEKGGLAHSPRCKCQKKGLSK